MIVRQERVPTGTGADGWLEGAPDVAVEIVGDGQSVAQLIKKALEYLRAGARAVWVLDPDARSVVVVAAPYVGHERAAWDAGAGSRGTIVTVSLVDGRSACTTSTAIDGAIAELYDVAVIPGIARAMALDPQILFLDESQAGCAKDKLVKTLQAEGVRIQHCVYEEQHKYRLYSEPKWWRHPPQIPKDLPGTTQVNRTAVRLPLFYEEAPELIEQYAKAFEKVWAHRSQLGRS